MDGLHVTVSDIKVNNNNIVEMISNRLRACKVNKRLYRCEFSMLYFFVNYVFFHRRTSQKIPSRFVLTLERISANTFMLSTDHASNRCAREMAKSIQWL